MGNYKVEGFVLDGKNQIILKSVITDDPMNLTRKLGIEKVSEVDTGEVLYDKHEVADASFGNWWKSHRMNN